MLVSTRRNDSSPKRGRQFPQVGTAVTTSRIQKNTYFSPRLAFCRAFLLPLPAVLVSPLPILLEKSDENGNQVQILNRPAAVNPFKIFEYFLRATVRKRMGRHSKRDKSEDLPRQHSFSAFGE